MGRCSYAASYANWPTDKWVTTLGNNFDMAATPLSLNASVWFFAGQLGESEPVRHVPINTLPFRIGRRSDLSLSLPYRSVSKEHAEILERNEQLWIRDLGSTNGTYVNGQRVEGEAPLKENDLVQFATVVFRVGREDSHTVTHTVQEDHSSDQALAMIQFERLISENAVVPFFQPILTLSDCKIMGFEVLGRSRLFGLMSPREMFSAASQLNMEAELSRVFRRQGVRAATELARDANLFVNTHPMELIEDGLEESLQEIRQLNPLQPITLEIHEAAVTNPDSTRQLRRILSDLNMQLAYDDFGAGQARLIELTEVRPDFLKFDMKLVQGIDSASPSRQQFVASLVQMVADLGVIPLAEGIETAAEHETCRQMGFRLGQGYHYGKPAPAARYQKSSKA